MVKIPEIKRTVELPVSGRLTITLDYLGTAEIWSEHEHGRSFAELCATNPDQADNVYRDAKHRVDGTFALAQEFLISHDAKLAGKIHEREFSIKSSRTVSYPMNFGTYYRDTDHFGTEFLHEQAHHHFVYPTDKSMEVTKDLVKLFPPESVPWGDPKAIETGGVLAKRMEYMARTNPEKIQAIADDVFGDLTLADDPTRLGSYIATYGHLVINQMEHQGASELFGHDEATALALANPGYTWIYQTMLDHQPEIQAVMERHHVTLKDPPSHQGHVADALRDYAESRGRCR